MLREETFGTLEWEDGKTVRGLVVVWRDGEDGDAFRGWLASAHREIGRAHV